MKIFEIIPQLSSGGAERFVVDLCNELSKGHEVTLLVLFPLNKTSFYLSQVSDKVRIETMNKKAGFDLPLFQRLRKMIDSEKPDVVHTHLRGIIYILPAACLNNKKTLFVHTVHNDAQQEAAEWFSRVARKFLFKTKKVIPVTISEESHKSFTEFYGIDAPMIFNGRNIPENIFVSDKVKNEFLTFKKSQNTKVIMNLARIDEVKRQTLLAKVISMLNQKGYDFSCIMIGSTKYKALVEDIKSYNCRNIFILGERTNPLEYLKLSDAFCLCSSYEGLPISLIESLGVGTMPICTPVGGIKDLIENGKNGILTEDLSENALYKALEDFLNMSEDEIITICTKAKESYRPFSMTECCNNYVNLFKQNIKS